jgi:glycosyltransferase involved in cell wall biosynthesis
MEFPPRFFWFQLQNYRYLINRLSSFDIIHGVYPDASTMVTFNREKLKKPFVVSFHAEPLSNARDFLKTPLSSWTLQDFAHQIAEFPMLSYNLRRCSEKADHIIVCSYSALREFQAAYNNLNLERVSVIHNAVNLDEIDGKEVGNNVPLESERESLKIVFAGRLFWVKGLLFLLKAFEMISHDYKNIKLDIFGQGPEETKMKKFVSTAGLSTQVQFCGRVSNQSLIKELKKADIVVAPSLHEAQSMIVIEAMACRKAVVAFAIPSMRELITNGNNGLLAMPFDSNDLSEKIRQVLDNEKLRNELGRNAREHIKEHHNLQKQVVEYLRVYSNFVA